MPYAREDYIRRRSSTSGSSRRRSRSSSRSNSGGPGLMPPEPLPPWDRKGELFRDRKNGFGHHHHHHRWRDAPPSPFPSGSRNSGDFSPRWGFHSDFRRPPGHLKQGGWHLYQEDSPHGYSTPRNGDRFLDDDCMRPSGPRGDSRYGRFYRDNRNGFNHKDGRGNYWENNHQYSGVANMPGRGLADTPGRGPTYTPGRGPADTLGRGPAYMPGRGPADTPGPGHAYMPGHGLADTPGRGPAYTPGHGPADTPGRGPAYTPGRGPAYTPGRGPADTPGRGPAYTPGRGPADTPGRGPAYTPGRGPADTPGRGPAYTPGRGPADTPGRGPAYTPGNGPADTPGCGPAYTPALGPTYTPAHGPTYTLAHDPGYTPACRPVELQARGPASTPARGPASTPAQGPANTPKRPHSVNSQRSVDESPVCHSLSNSDPTGQLPSKNQIDRPGNTNGSGESQKIGKESSLGSLDWKPLKWSRSGSLISRGSGFSYSSSSKSNGGESSDVVGDLVTAKKAISVQSPSGEVAACRPCAVLPEEISSRKKPRLGWGEGLAKYEKKKVEGPEDNVMKIENTAAVGNVEPTHSVTSALIDKSPKITGFSDCSSPATPSSFACSSSPGLEKTYGKSTDGYPNNFSVSSMPVSKNQPEEMQFSLEKLELNSIANLSSLLSQLLQVDDQCSLGSGFMRSSAFNKLLLWKADISKALELTEAEIDALDNELQLLKPDFGEGVPFPGSSLLLLKNDKDSHVDGLSGFTKHNCEEIDSPGVATSDFVGPLSIQNPVSPCVWKRSCSADDVLVESSRTVPENLFTFDNAEITEGRFRQGDDAKTINVDGVTTVVNDPGVCSTKEDNICDIILTSNRDTAAKASEVLIKLLPSDNNVNGIEAKRLSCLPADNTTKEKFLRHKRLLIFKERAISLKYRAFHHLWKEDLRLNSLTSHRMKHHKKLDLIPRTMLTSYQKHRPSIRSRFASPAGSLSLVPTTEFLNYTRKLLSEPQVKTYRSNLKMPAMILDEKEKRISRLVSSNGLVEDPCAVEKERALINPWTIEEKELFMEKLTSFGKDFGKIASFLDHKTIADCVQFYYKNHKSECFEKTKKLHVRKQANPSDTYMRSTRKKWGNRETNSASLDVLGAASVIAAQADQAMKSSKSLSGKLSNRRFRGSNGILEPSTCFNIAEDERETVAADVLAGICGSFSSEPMSSCITSSVKRPLTPDVTQNVNVDDGEDGTCSDESCGEMDPADWTDDEKSLFVRAFSSHGKDFLLISRFVRTKTREQCKVFFSKARKCLGLETSQPDSFSGGLRGSNDTNCSGSDVEDAVGVVETGSVGYSGKSGSGMDEEFPRVSEDVSNPSFNDVDLSTSEENRGPRPSEGKDTDIEPKVLCPSHDLSNVASDDDIQRSLLITQDDPSKDIDPKSNEVTNGKSVSACENTDPLLSNGLVNSVIYRDGKCKQSTECGSSLVNEGVGKKLMGVPLDLSNKAGVNGDVTHRPEPEKKVQAFQECYFRKCSRLASQNAVAELPLLPKSEGRATNSSSDTKKPCNNGDVKLFGKILSKPSSSVQRYNETANHHLTPVAEHDQSGFVGLENVPVRNYGIWDGSKIKVVSYPPPTNSSSALLLAKYPVAFANGSVPEQQTVQVPVNSSECNLNNACSFSPREYNSGDSSIVDHPVFKNRDGVSPFMLDFKQRQNVFPCTSISDPVAVLRSQYPSQRYNGSSSSGGVDKAVNGVAREVKEM